MKEGRGRLSSIQLLPDEAWPHVRAAIKGLAENRRSQEHLREELNSHLLALGLDPISKSAFNRHALKLSIAGRKLLQKREAMHAFMREIGDKPDTATSLAISEMGKSMVWDIIEAVQEAEDGTLSPKDLAALGLAFMRFTKSDHQTAQAAHALLDLADKETRREVEKAVSAAGTSAGLSEATVRKLRENFLGIRPKLKTEQQDAPKGEGPGPEAPT